MPYFETQHVSSGHVWAARLVIALLFLVSSLPILAVVVVEPTLATISALGGRVAIMYVLYFLLVRGVDSWVAPDEPEQAPA